MSNHYGIPGIGGSLGKCAVCGDAFVVEIITGKNIASFRMEQFTQTLYAHEGCMETLVSIKESGASWTELPNGPIKEAFTEIAKRQDDENQT